MEALRQRLAAKRQHAPCAVCNNSAKHAPPAPTARCQSQWARQCAAGGCGRAPSAPPRGRSRLRRIAGRGRVAGGRRERHSAAQLRQAAPQNVWSSHRKATASHCPHACLQHIRHDGAWAHGIDADAVRRQRERHAARQVLDAALARVVAAGRGAGWGDQAAWRGRQVGERKVQDGTGARRQPTTARATATASKRSPRDAGNGCHAIDRAHCDDGAPSRLCHHLPRRRLPRLQQHGLRGAGAGWANSDLAAAS